MADWEPIARTPSYDSSACCRRCPHRTQITLGIKPHASQSPVREVDGSASRNLAGGILNSSPAVVEALVNRAAGSSGVLAHSVAAGVGAVQGGASLYSLAFAGSEIDPRASVTDSLTAAVLANIVLEVLTPGESFYLPEVRRGHAFLLPMSGVTVNGVSPDRETWTYEDQVNRLDHSVVGRYSARRVIHVQWSYDATRPWIGISPLQRCSQSAEFLAAIERGLRSELARESHYILPIPTDPARSDCDQWVKDLTGSRGGGLIAGRTMMGSAVAGIGSTPKGDFEQSRLGPEPNRESGELRAQVQAAVLMAMGVDPALANADPKTGALQAPYRSFLTGSAASLVRVMTSELCTKLERCVRVRFAADVDNRRLRSAALKNLIEARVPLERALTLAGFDFA